jgi:hypothetical protein
MPSIRDRDVLLIVPAMIFGVVLGLMALFGVVNTLAAIGAATIAGMIGVGLIAWAMQPNDRDN